jgi:hypothetical protein
VPNRSDSVEQWGSHKSDASGANGASARRYEYLFSSNMRVTDLRVNKETWDRIAHGLPRAYTMPDETLLGWVAEWVQERRQAEEEIAVEAEMAVDDEAVEGSDEPTEPME